MAKPELGSKHQCQNCGAKFFDLNKDPIICPKCGTVFQGVAVRARPTSKPEEEEAELATPAGVEVVSLDEVEAGEEKAAEPVVDDIDVEEDAETTRRMIRSSKRKRKTTTTSATSSTATSPPTRKPERRGMQAALPKSGARGRSLFLAGGLVGAASLRLYPSPSEGALRPNRSRDRFLENGAIAQLGERFNGIEEVVGSIPSGSTNQPVDITGLSVSLNIRDISGTCAPGALRKSQ